MLSFSNRFSSDTFFLAKGDFLVSYYMFCRIRKALNSYLGLPATKELNMSIRPSDNFVLIGNQPFSLCLVIHNHDGSLACWLIHSESDSFDKRRTQIDFISCQLILPKYW